MTTIVITGGGRGIGAATARKAALAGWDVAIDYAGDDAAARATVAACEATGRRAVAVKGDVSDPAHVVALFNAAAGLGPVGALVNNAGIVGARGAFETISPEALRRTFEVNVVGAMLCAQEAVHRMSTVHGGAHGGAGGAIVNISSIAATLGSPGEYVHYAASKGAIDSLTIGLAKELGRQGIRVNAVQAGTTLTDIHGREGNPDRPAQVAAAAPLGRCAEPDEIADAVLYLLSDQARYVTGAILRVGGGL
ncbi:MAG: SDR family oxidoreductase [Acetobacterales bacterium]